MAAMQGAEYCRAVALGAFLSLTLVSAADWTISVHGAGPIRLGMSVADVRDVLRDPDAALKGNEPEVPLNKCAYLEGRRVPRGMSLMFSAGRLVRIDVDERGVKTSEGAGVGDSEKRIQRLYRGRITVEPHHYDPKGRYLNYSPPNEADRGYGIVFETDGVKVTSF